MPSNSLLASMEDAHFYGLKPESVLSSKSGKKERTFIQFGDLELVVVTNGDMPHLAYFIGPINDKKVYYLSTKTFQNNIQDTAHKLLMEAVTRIGYGRVYNRQV